MMGFKNVIKQYLSVLIQRPPLAVLFTTFCYVQAYNNIYDYDLIIIYYLGHDYFIIVAR